MTSATLAFSTIIKNETNLLFMKGEVKVAFIMPAGHAGRIPVEIINALKI